MRTHFLKALSVVGSGSVLEAFPDFDFYNLGQVTCLLFTGAQGRPSADLVVTADYRDPSSGTIAQITLRFGGVRHARLPELTPLFYFSELEVEDVRSHGLEGIRYKIKDYGSGDFEVFAWEIVVLKEPNQPIRKASQP